MANTLLTISMITREALRVLKNQIVFTSKVNREYSDKFGVEGAKIGSVLNVRKPPRYIGRVGQALAIENATEQSVPVALTTQRGVDIQFSSADLALSIDDFSARFIKPAIATVANAIDYDGLQLFKQVYSSANTTAPGTSPTSLEQYLAAGVKLDDQACPQDGERYVIVTPDAQAALVGNLTAIFNPQSQIAEQYRKGQMGMAAGFTFSMDQNVGRLTCGTRDNTTPLTNAATAQTGSSLICDGFDNSVTLVEGDVFTIDGVYSVNPMSRQSTGVLQQFVVTADTAVSGTGTVTIPIAPAIVASGPFQNVSNGAANDKALTFVGTASTGYAQNLAFHRDAFAFVTADLPLPGGVDMAARVSDKDTGLSIRMVRAYDVNSDAFPCRLDVLYGWAALRPELACRIWAK
jgi:hypothetical protein